MGFDFKHLKTAGTARHTIGGLMPPGRPTPVLIMRHAGNSNAGWKNAKAKWDIGRKGNSTFDHADNEAIAEIFSRHVITGWENVTNSDGNPVAFSAVECLEFLVQIIRNDDAEPSAWDKIWGFAREASNFRALPEGAAEEVGKG